MLIVLLIILIPGCLKNNVVKPNVYCNRPVYPLIEKLDETKDYCTKENAQVLLKALNIMDKYSKEAESTIQCYEEQYKKK